MATNLERCSLNEPGGGWRPCLEGYWTIRKGLSKMVRQQHRRFSDGIPVGRAVRAPELQVLPQALQGLFLAPRDSSTQWEGAPKVYRRALLCLASCVAEGVEKRKERTEKACLRAWWLVGWCLERQGAWCCPTTWLLSAEFRLAAP